MFRIITTAIAHLGADATPTPSAVDEKQTPPPSPVSPSASDAKNTPAAADEEISWLKILYHVVRKYSDIKSSGIRSYGALRAMLTEWMPAIKEIQALIRSIQNKINEMSDDHPDDKDGPTLKSAFQHFSSNLDEFIKLLGRMIEDLGKKQEREKKAIDNGIKLASKLEEVISSFSYLRLSEKIKKMLPESLDSLKKSSSKFWAEHVKTLIPDNLSQQLAAFNAEQQDLTPAQFVALSNYEKQIKLALAEHLNKTLKDLFLLLDELGIIFSIKSGYVSHTKFPWLGNKSLHEHVEEFTKLYRQYMEACDYKPVTEYYPYHHAIYLQRERMRRETAKEIEEINHRLTDAGVNTDAKAKEHQLAYPTAKQKRLIKRMNEDKAKNPQVPPGYLLSKKEFKSDKIADVASHAYKVVIPQLKLTYEKLKAEIFTPASADNKDEEKSASLETQLAVVDKKLKEVFDEKVYSAFFVEQKIPATPGKNAPWIVRLGTNFFTIKTTLLSLKKSVESDPEAKEHKKTPAEDLIATVDVMKESIKKMEEVVSSSAAILRDPFVKQFTSQKPATEYLEKLFQPVIRHKEEYKKLNLTLSAASSGLDKIIDLVDIFYTDHHVTEGSEAKTAANQALTGLRETWNAFKTRYNDSLNTLSSASALYFAIQNKEAIFSKLLSNLALFSKSLLGVSKITGLEVAQRVNLFFRDLFLVLDRIEVQLYLREGYLTRMAFNSSDEKAGEAGISLHSIIEKFQRTIKENGYIFKEEERYPYVVSLRAQREQLIAVSHYDLEREFIRSRNARLVAAPLPPVEQAGISVNNVLNLIDLKTQRLKESREESYYLFAENSRLHIENSISALTALRNIVKKQGYTFEDALTELATTHNRWHKYLFYHHNDFLREVREMDAQIAPQTRGEKLINVIAMPLSVIPIHEPEAAIPLHTAKNPQNTGTTDAKYSAPDEKTALLGQAVPASDAAGAILPVADAKFAAGVAQALGADEKQPLPVVNPLVNYFNNIIDKRLNELRNSYQSNVVKNKIYMLEQIKEKLPHKSLDKSIEEVRDKSENHFRYYLLREGRTGSMLKKLEYSQLTKKDMAQRIQLEIIGLEKERRDAVNAWFGTASRRQTLADRINALGKLKIYIADANDNNSLQMTLNKLNPIERASIHKHEQVLLTDLYLWDDSRKECLREVRQLKN